MNREDAEKIVGEMIQNCIDVLTERKNVYVKELLEWGEAGFSGGIELEKNCYLSAKCDFEIKNFPRKMKFKENK